MDLTVDIQLIQRCVATEAPADCNQGCAWRHGKDATAPTTPGQGTPLFSTDFCHPVVVNKDTPSVSWTTCVALADSSSCSDVTYCNWSDGKELIGKDDFCAPMDLTNDVTLIQSCVKADSATTCGTGCSWRHGTDGPTTPPTTPTTPTTPPVNPPVNPPTDPTKPPV
jgi:hypothetical protein